MPGFFRSLWHKFLDDGGAGVEILVHAVPEAHELALVVLDALHEGRGGGFAVPQHLQHLDDFLVGPAVQPAPEGADASPDDRVNVGQAGTRHAHGGGAAILLVVGA